MASDESSRFICVKRKSLFVAPKTNQFESKFERQLCVCVCVWTARAKITTLELLTRIRAASVQTFFSHWQASSQRKQNVTFIVSGQTIFCAFKINRFVRSLRRARAHRTNVCFSAWHMCKCTIHPLGDKYQRVQCIRSRSLTASLAISVSDAIYFGKFGYFWPAKYFQFIHFFVLLRLVAQSMRRCHRRNIEQHIEWTGWLSTE